MTGAHEFSILTGMFESRSRKSILPDHFWIWGPPGFCLLGMALVHFADANLDLFLSINEVSLYTGDMFWAVLTFFSDGLVSFVILLPWIKRRPQIIWAVLLATILSTVFSQGVKRLVNVARPPQALPAEAFHLIGPDWGHYSFPSGHASMIFILAGVFSFLTSKRWLRSILISAASIVAISRIAVGVHWPLDVLAGAAIGWSAAWLGLFLSRHSQWGYSEAGRKILGLILLGCCLLLFVVDYTGYENIMIFQRSIAFIFFFLGSYEYLKVFGIFLFSKSGSSR